MSSSDVHAELLEVETRVIGYMAQLTHDHRSLQELDVEDPRAFRPFLDRWMDWHLDAAYWVILAKQQRAIAHAAFRTAWQDAVAGTTEAQFRTRGIHFTGSYEERKVLYELKSTQPQITLDVLNRVVDTMHDFIRTLKTIHDYWDKRRIDTKWETERRDRTPGSDYAT